LSHENSADKPVTRRSEAPGGVVAEQMVRGNIGWILALAIGCAALAGHGRESSEEVMGLAASNREPMAGDMRLGVIPTISPFLLHCVLPGLNRRYPALRLYLREEQTTTLLDRLRAGDIDVALIALPYDIEGLAFKNVLRDEFEFACNENNPLANEKVITLDAFADPPLMLLEEGHCLRGHALDACQLYDRRDRAQFEASSLHTLVQMVAAGIGVTLLPKLAIDARITRGTNIRLVPLSTVASRQIGLVWRQSSLRAREFELLGDTLVSLVNG